MTFQEIVPVEMIGWWIVIVAMWFCGRLMLQVWDEVKGEYTDDLNDRRTNDRLYFLLNGDEAECEAMGVTKPEWVRAYDPATGNVEVAPGSPIYSDDASLSGDYIVLKGNPNLMLKRA